MEKISSKMFNEALKKSCTLGGKHPSPMFSWRKATHQSLLTNRQHVPGTVLGAENIKVKKIGFLPPRKFIFFSTQRDGKDYISKQT